jgi:hypothetical protein
LLRGEFTVVIFYLKLFKQITLLCTSSSQNKKEQAEFKGGRWNKQQRLGQKLMKWRLKHNTLQNTGHTKGRSHIKG